MKRRYLLDTNALGYSVHRQHGVYERGLEERRRGATIGTAIPVVAEIIGGALYSESWQLNLQRIETAIAGMKVWPFDYSAAREYARLYAELRRTGVTMQVIDRMIAAIALTIPNCTVVTRDSDFRRVPGLRFENWEV